MSRARRALVALVPCVILAVGHVQAWRIERTGESDARGRLAARAADAASRFAAFLDAARSTARRAAAGDVDHTADGLPSRWANRLEGAGRVRAGDYSGWFRTPAEVSAFPPGPDAASRIVARGMRTSLLVRTAVAQDGTFGTASFTLELGDEGQERINASLSRSAGESSVRWIWLPSGDASSPPRFVPGPPATYDAPVGGPDAPALARVVVEDRPPASRAAGVLARARAWSALAAVAAAILLLLRRPRPVDARRALLVVGAAVTARAALAAARSFEELLPRDAGSPSLYGHGQGWGLLSSPAALAATALCAYLIARTLAAWAAATSGARRRVAAAVLAGGAAAFTGALIFLAASLPRDVRLAVPRFDLSSPPALLVAAALALLLAAAAEPLAGLLAALAPARRGTVAGRLLVAVALIPVCGVVLAVLDATADRVTEERLRSEFAPLVLEQTSLRRLALSAAVDEAASDPRAMRALTAEDAPADAFAAFALWSAGDLFHQGFASSLDVYDAAGQRRSHFGFGLPAFSGSRESTPQGEPGAASPVIESERVPVGATIERVLHAEIAIVGPNGVPAGRIVGHVLEDPGNLPFLPSNAPYLQALGRGPFPNANPASEPPDYVLFDGAGRVELSTLRRPPAATPELRAAAEEGRIVAIEAGDMSYSALALADGPSLHLLLAPRPTALDATADGVRLLLLGLAVVALSAVGATLFSSGGVRALVALVQGSFYRKLLAAVLLASVVPLVALAVVLRGTIERRGAESLAESASTIVGAAQRVVEDYQAVADEDATSPPIRPTDETLSWLKRVVGQEIHLYEGGTIAATSKPELFDSGLLRRRLPGQVARSVVDRGEPYLVRPERWGALAVTVAYAPVEVQGGPKDAVLAVPLVTEQRQRTRAVDRLIEMLLLGTTALVALLAASSAMLARSVAQPVSRLALASRRIAEGDYATRLSSTSGDEVGSLVADFNRMAQALADQRADLVRRSDYIEALLRHATTGVVSTDASGRIVTINPAASALLGIGAGPVRGEPLVALLESTSTTRPLAAALAAAGPDGGEPIEVDLPGPESITRLRVVLVPLPDPAAGETGSLVLLDDVTGLMRSNQLAAWAEMARAVAHEIKNPLTPVQLSAEHIRRLLADRGVLPAPEIEACLDTIVRQVRELRDISSAFSTYARLPDLVFEPIDPAGFLREVAAPYRAAAPPGIAFTERYGEAPAILGDRRTLARAVVNLIENALQAMPHGGSLVLASDRDPRADGAVLSVADSGPGLSAEARGRLFEPYFSTKSAGTGLGLPIVRRVVEAHRGTVSVVSVPGGGTTFTLHLPAADGP
jgi:signal transduction histidine kinase/HAMP domain-containing protein